MSGTLAIHVLVWGALSLPLFAQTTEVASVSYVAAWANDTSFNPNVSADGRYVVFCSAASNMDGSVDPGVFVHDRLAVTTERASVNSSGVPPLAPGCQYWMPSIAADGQVVAFESDAPTLVPGDTNWVRDVFVRDRQTGVTERASVGSGGIEGNLGGRNASLSADGRFVAFDSLSTNLVPADTNNYSDVFVYDRQTKSTERVSVSSSGAQGNQYSGRPALSADGRFVAFESSAVLVPGSVGTQIYVRDRLNGTTELASVSSAGVRGNLMSRTPSISLDGRWVSFTSAANNLVPGDTNMHYDVFVHDRQSGVTQRVSVTSAGVQADGDSGRSAISGDGRCVVYASSAPNLTPGMPQNGNYPILHDCWTGVTECVSYSSSGAAANAGLESEEYPRVSDDGRVVVFGSYAWNLVLGDLNGVADVFVRDRGVTLAGFCFSDGGASPCPCGNNGANWRGCENSSGTGGAVLLGAGLSSLANDALVLTCLGELPHAPTLVLQGTAAVAPTNFGDGLLCTSGVLKPLYLRSASGGALTVPQAGDLSVSARSAALGDVIAPGEVRYYQAYYRDPLGGFCPSPTGAAWNISSGLRVIWN